MWSESTVYGLLGRGRGGRDRSRDVVLLEKSGGGGVGM